MLPLLIILIFLIFAALMLARKLPAILAVPAMAILFAASARVPLEPVVRAVNFGSPLVYALFFSLLSPLALYRGPLNPYGSGIGVYALIGNLGLLPPLALLAAVMSVVQVQSVCDPTNTHNVWVANFVGVRVEEITRAPLVYKMIVCLLGLVVGSFLYLR